MREGLRSEKFKPYIRLLRRLIVTAVVVLLIILIVPLILTNMLPFVLAFIAATMFNPLIIKIQKKWNAPRSVLSIFTVVLGVLVVAGIIGRLLYTLIRELITVAQNIDGIIYSISNFIQALPDTFEWLSDAVPLDTEEIITGLTENLIGWLQEHGTAFADLVIAHTVDITTQVGNAFITIVFFIMASYFIMSDYPAITTRIKGMFSTNTYEEIDAFKAVSFSAIGGYLKTQFIMASIMFLFTLIGFLILGIDFAFLLAFIVAILDFLPAVGAALILIPMGIFSLINGEVGQAVFLFVMYLGTFILRRTIEPKIMGSQMGLSPLMALFSLYVGMRLGGIPGLILGPIVAVVLIGLHKSGAFNGWISDVKEIAGLIKKRQDEH